MITDILLIINYWGLHLNIFGSLQERDKIVGMPMLFCHILLQIPVTSHSLQSLSISPCFTLILEKFLFFLIPTKAAVFNRLL